ncbi:MAG: hypothetical protein FWC50_16275 [Planctomycetaceae bacterium]|nr:hypothetical protein [Planctomycetaceae bacterium]
MKKFATFCFALMFVLIVATGCPAKPSGPGKKAVDNGGTAPASAKEAAAPALESGHHAKDGHNHAAAATTEETK